MSPADDTVSAPRRGAPRSVDEEAHPMDAVTQVPQPVNEPVLDYAPGSPERAAVEQRLAELAGTRHELTMTIGGEQRLGAGRKVKVVQPHAHRQVLGTLGTATKADAAAAVAAAKRAAPGWRALSYDDRAAVFLKAAALLAGPWRQTLNAATMLGQSKTVLQAEIDASCELIDFWRFNVHFGRQLIAEQPEANAPGIWNRLDHRPLEGFVYAITPFNFTAIGGNLPTAPALMGNTVVWKPASSAMLSGYYIFRLLERAGLPPGVINFVPGDPIQISSMLLDSPDLAGIHFTGSTAVFNSMWRKVGENVGRYRSYPRIVGETGGKDFIIAHPSADPQEVAVAVARGAFEYQGQKCSAASRIYVPQSLWPDVRDRVVGMMRDMKMGDVADFRIFLGAVIDRKAFDKLSGYLDDARKNAKVIQGGTARGDVGY